MAFRTRMLGVVGGGQVAERAAALRMAYRLRVARSGLLNVLTGGSRTEVLSFLVICGIMIRSIGEVGAMRWMATLNPVIGGVPVAMIQSPEGLRSVIRVMRERRVGGEW